MPTVTLPVPPQTGHAPLAARPLPPQLGQTSSPVPGVPAGASSPGLIFGWAPDGRSPRAPAGWSDLPGDAAAAAMSMDAPGSSSPATDWARSRSSLIGASPNGPAGMLALMDDFCSMLKLRLLMRSVTALRPLHRGSGLWW